MHLIFLEAEAEHKARVMFDTFGHLDAKVGEKHEGWFVFIHGQHGDMDVVRSHFPTFGEGPGYYTDRDDYMDGLMREGGPCHQFGIYRFDGYYTLPKRKNARRFVGQVTRMMVFE